MQNLIARGIRDTKLTALRCVTEMDAGDVYLKCPLVLDGTAEEILRRAGDLTAEMIKAILQGGPVPPLQAGEVTTFRRRTPQENDMAGLTDLERVYDHIRMLDAEGYPAAFLEIGDLQLEFRGARLRSDAVEATVHITRKKP